MYNAEVGTGRLFEKPMEVVVGQSVVNKIGLKIGDTFYSSHGFIQDDDTAHDHVSLKVVGILKASGSVLDQLILCDPASVWLMHEHDHEDGHAVYDSMVNLLDYPDKEITSLLVQFKNRTNFQALNLPRNINENTDMQAASPAIEINRLYDMVGVGTRALQMLAILISIVSAISIFISLFSSLKARKYELALMRVMGAGPGSLFILIILEGLILAILSFCLGMLISHIAMWLLSGELSEAYKYEFVSWKMTGKESALLGMSLLLGLVASVIPAYRAYRTDIHQTLSKI
jgi:putative ABC transport system permease protein